MYKVLGDNELQDKIRTFTDLVAWQKAHELVVDIYSITNNFPTSEQFGLTSQLRRAAVSVSSNIAEGFSRSTKPDKLHFYVMAQGSHTELQSQLLIARDIDYLAAKVCTVLVNKSKIVQKLIHRLSKSLKEGKGVRNE